MPLIRDRLLFPPFATFPPQSSLPVSLFSFSSRSLCPSTSLPCSSRNSTPIDTTGHDTDHEEGLLSHSPLSSLIERVPPFSNASPVAIALPLVVLSSQPTSSIAALKTCHSVPFPSLSSYGRSVFVSRSPLHLSRSRPVNARDWFPLVLLSTWDSAGARARTEGETAEKRAKGRFNASTPR